MRFFKYLFFIFLSSICYSAHAAYWINVANPSQYLEEPQYGGYSALYACQYFFGSSVKLTPSASSIYSCNTSSPETLGKIQKLNTLPALECFYPDYKIVTQPITSLKKTMCLPINGAICKYTGDPVGAPILDGYITTTFSSVSKTPDPSCKEELVNPPCDPKDPYGGCFTPPDDGCTRQFNGSIVCPPDKVPTVEKGCSNGATYCDRPPQGCGQGYVSGNYNGRQICIKTNPSNPPADGDGDSDNTGQGTGTSTTSGTSTTTTTTTNQDGSTSTSTSTTTTNNTTFNNFSIDFAPVIKAINDVSSKITDLKNELLTSITDLGNKLDSTNTKLDSTNTKLDSTNAKLTEINDSSLRQEELLKAIRDKESSNTGGDGSPDQPASGASIDLTETNDILKEIRDFLTGDPEAPEGESVPTGELTERSFSSDLITVNAAYCPADKEINWSTPMGQFNKTVSYRPICDSSSWLGYLFLALAYVFGAMIVVRDT